MSERKHPQARCEECPLQNKGTYVPTEFNDPDLFIVGEAPGGTEARKGRPFVGQSGQLLEIALSSEWISREAASFTNVVACRPRGNAKPDASAINACRPRLESELSSAKTIVACGNTAASAITGTKTKITRDRVGPPKRSALYPGASVIPTFHPAACLRDPDKYPSLETDISKIHNAAVVDWVDPDYRVFGDCEDTVMGARIALEQILQRDDLDPLAIDLEVGEEKDESFGHPERLLSAGISYSSRAGIVIGESGLQDRKVRELLAKIVRSKRTIWHNAKYDLQVLFNVGVASGRAYWDTMLASYVLDERRGVHGLKYIAKEFLGAPDWDAELKDAGGFEEAPRHLLYKYNAYDAITTYRLYELQREDARWDSNCDKLFPFLMRAQHVLMHVEIEGIRVDEAELQKLDIELTESIEQQVEQLQPETDKWLKHLKTKSRPKRFNPNSWQQVLAMLYWKGVKLPNTDKKTLLTAVETIDSHKESDKLQDARQFILDILALRKETKLHGTYVKGVQSRLHKDRMHTTFMLHGTTTGRTSSRNVNIQNVPRKASIRRVYIPEEGNTFIQADYKNIEGRVVFVLSSCESGRRILMEGRDLHGEVAAQVYGPNYDKEQRTKAKTIVHGVNYRRTPHGIASDPEIGLDLKEAQEVFEAYKALVPEVFEWQQKMEKYIFSPEDLVTPFGRRRRFALVTDQNREDILKEGIAFLPQSIASDITLSATIALWERGFAIRNFVHDSVLIEAPQGEAHSQGKEAARIMEQIAVEVYTDWIPFPVEYEIGPSWGDLVEQ